MNSVDYISVTPWRLPEQTRTPSETPGRIGGIVGVFFFVNLQKVTV